LRISSSCDPFFSFCFVGAHMTTIRMQQVPGSLVPTKPLEASDNPSKFSLLGIKFSYVFEFVALVGGVDNVIGKTTTQVKDLLLPITQASGLSLCDQLLVIDGRQDVVGRATWFISHAWGYDFLQVMEAIDVFLSNEYGSASSRDIIIWFDLFSNSQHKCEERPFEWWESTFRNAIHQLQNVLMILHPWNEPLTLKRAWCVFEIFACESTGSRFEVSMSVAESGKFLTALSKGNAIDEFRNMLKSVDTQKSEAWKAEDRDRIHEAVRRLIKGGFVQLDSMVLRIFENWMLLTLSWHMKHERNETVLAGLQSNAARLLFAHGKPLEGIEYARSSFALFRQLLGPDNPSSLGAANILGLLYAAAGLHDAAEPLYVMCYESNSRLYGCEHPETLTSLNNLAVFYKERGNIAAAEPLFTRCLEMQQVVLGPTHPYSLRTAHNLSVIQQAHGRYDEAAQLCKQCLDARIGTLGENHVETLTTMSNLAFILTAQEQYVDAESYFGKCLPAMERLLGSYHPDTLICMSNAAGLYRRQGNYRRAEELFSRCFRFRQERMGPEHPITIDSLFNLAGFYSFTGKLEEAERLCFECLRLSRKALGSECAETLDSVNNLAIIYKKRGNYAAAEPLYIECLDGRTRLYGPEHPEVFDSMCNLAEMHVSDRRYIVAEEILIKCLDGRERILDPQHEDIKDTIKLLVEVYEGLGDSERAALYRSRLVEGD
jgi:tetratricopeptide (TPR) repeat protein